ncbi:response regulator [Uliginosibacterium sp. H1]|uniref:response regulator n=1 Tax=Uliginosibacterium sp. H1 TaxID=3114757 RepID=UPI002E173638|nr:response regulator [Uliginosibacterium sp. H1]
MESSTLTALRVFLVEDSPLLRQVLSETLSTIPGVQVIGAADTESEALDELQDSPADLVVVDIELRHGSGLGVLKALKTDPGRFHAVRPVVLTNFAHATIRHRCTELGCPTVFDKSMQVDDLIRHVEQQRTQHLRT